MLCREVAGNKKAATTTTSKTMTVKTPNNLVAKLAAKLKGKEPVCGLRVMKGSTFNISAQIVGSIG